MKTGPLWIACVVAVAAGLHPARAGSIWARGEPRARAAYTDDTARRRGDSLTIVINERSRIDNETNRKLEKKDDRTASMSGTLDPANLVGHPVGKTVFDFPRLSFASSAETKFDGDSEFESDHSLQDQVTVTVVDVLPNGNLVVAGGRQRQTDGDLQTIEVTGIVRPSDIAFNNTVSSSRVADFRISYAGKGSEKQYTRPGWFARILDLINPF